MMFGGMFFFWLFGLLFMGLIVWALWRLLFGDSGKPFIQREESEDEALRQLRLRLASGEIDETEYQRLKQLLIHEERTP